MGFVLRLTNYGILAIFLTLFCVTLTRPVAAQIPGISKAKTAKPEKQEEPKDPFGRSTPRGTMTGLMRAANSGDVVSAVRYMQLTSKQRPNTEILVRDLKDLMDRYFRKPISTISDSAEGFLDDGLALDREEIGPLRVGEGEFSIELVRVKDKEAGQIWLISSDTLNDVPAYHGAIEKTWIERLMPEELLDKTILGISYEHVIGWTASIGIPLLLFSLVFLIFATISRKIFRNPVRRQRAETRYAALRWPITIVLTLIIHLLSLFALRLSLRFRIIYGRIVAALLVLAVAWLIRRILTLSFSYTRRRMQRAKQTGKESLIVLGERLIKALIILVAIFVVLTISGVDTQTALAGVGIFGVALAVGAQKTVENFLGGFFLLTDKVIAVGDNCSISNRSGTVEDITLRSVRLRTTEQTLLSIPAGVLSQDTIENFTTRGKILIKTTLRLRYETTTEQLRSILDRVRKLLSDTPEIETETCRIRLVDFGVRSIELELFAYVLTTNYSEFLAVREDLLLQIAGIVEEAGSRFAGPDLVEIPQKPVVDKTASASG
ncbi:MAG TPA: mechanosensitive ion channel family protein [Blastocatellia bacterium]|nr:mechanosensitive ion channel family protein [Blastocatellia bacterium]